MTTTEIRIAKRVATYMLESAESGVDLSFFQGLGLALAIVYEESTGISATDKKPKFILEWAQALPSVSYPHVRTN